MVDWRSGPAIGRCISGAAAVLSLVAIAWALWDLLLRRDEDSRDSIRILLLAGAALFVAYAALKRPD